MNKIHNFMHKYTFLGTVHPERASFNLAGMPEPKIILPDIGIEGEVSIVVEKSKLKLGFLSDADLRTHREQDALVSLKNYLGEYVRLFVDTFCYVKSLNYDVEIYKVECAELGIDYTFDVQLETDLGKDDGDAAQQMEDIVSLISRNPEMIFVKDVFADFRRGIKYPHMSGFFFYRALETVKKNAFNDDWGKMNSALGFNPPYYSNLNKFRKPNAHGTYPTITGAERIKLAKDARKVIDAFLKFSQKNSVSL